MSMKPGWYKEAEKKRLRDMLAACWLSRQVQHHGPNEPNGPMDITGFISTHNNGNACAHNAYVWADEWLEFMWKARYGEVDAGDPGTGGTPRLGRR